jgi:hypothetical protein
MSDNICRAYDLPDYETCAKAVQNNVANPIEYFIYNNEPAGVDAVKFREQLKDALICAIGIHNLTR